MATISVAGTDAEIQRCFPVVLQLRPHLVEAKFMERVRQQQKRHGYLKNRLHIVAHHFSRVLS